MDAKKLKLFAKGAAQKPTFGTNPFDPWSSKANISEDSLSQYLLSRGINPEHLSLPTKIAHSKSQQFIKWKQDHMKEEHDLVKKPTKKEAEDVPKGNQNSEAIKNEERGYQTSKGSGPLTADKKSEHQKAQSHYKEIKTPRGPGSQNEETVNEVSDKTLTSYLTKVDADSRKSKMDPTKRPAHKANKSVMGFSRAFNKLDSRKGVTEGCEQNVTEGWKEKVGAAALAGALATGAVAKDNGVADAIRDVTNARTVGHVIKKIRKHRQAEKNKAPEKKDVKGQGVTEGLADDFLSVAKKVNPNAKMRTGAQPKKEPVKVEPQQKSPSTGKTGLAANHGYGQGRYMGDSVELEGQQIDEISKELATGYMYSAKNDRNKIDKKISDASKKQGDGFSMKRHSNIGKLLNKSMKRTTGIQRALDRVKEDVEQIDELKKSTLASYVKGAMKDREERATGASFKSGAAGDKYNKADETEKEVKREKGIDRALGKLTKEEKSFSARLVKEIFKKNVVKEDLYDHEKEDKSVATYGKKPKHDKADEKDSKGENKPRAAAVLSGGTTLTGSPRDTVEIDPMMRVRPGQPDPTKKDDKKKDEKKDEFKKDK